MTIFVADADAVKLAVFGVDSVHESASCPELHVTNPPSRLPDPVLAKLSPSSSVIVSLSSVLSSIDVTK